MTAYCMLISQQAQINILLSCIFKMSENVLSKNKPANLFKFGGAVVLLDLLFYFCFLYSSDLLQHFSQQVVSFFPTIKASNIKGSCASPEKQKYLSCTYCRAHVDAVITCFRLTCSEAAEDLAFSKQHPALHKLCSDYIQIYTVSQVVFEQTDFAAMT